MESAEIEVLIDEFEQRVERLRALYDQYFMGIEKIEPTVLRKDVDRRLWVLRREQIRNTGLRFKLNTIVQRYNTYQQYWMRICREIENGTYKRDLRRAAKRFGSEALTAQARKRLGKQLREELEEEEAQARKAAEADSFDVDLDVELIDEGPGASAAARAPVQPKRRVVHSVSLDELDNLEDILGLGGGAAAKPSAGPRTDDESTQPFGRLDDLFGEAEGDQTHPPPRAPAVPAAPSTRPATAQGGSPSRAAPPPPRLTGGAGGLPPRTGTVPGGPTVPGPLPAPVPPPTGMGLQRKAPAGATPAAPPVTAASATSSHRPVPAANGTPAPRTPYTSTAPARQPPPIATAPTTLGNRPVQPAASTASRAVPPTQSAASRAAPAATDAALSEARMREIYSRYVQAKRDCRESTSGITEDALARSLRATADKLRSQHKGRQIDFDVVIKDGKAVLKPVVKG